MRGAPGVDGLEEVDELVAMADVGDAAGIAGAGLEAGLTGDGGVDLVVTGDLLLELPERANRDCGSSRSTADPINQRAAS